MPEITLNNLKISKGAKRKAKRVGRGNASGHGTYSTRGLKGQRSRSGGRKGLKRFGLNTMIRNKPKLGGFKSLYLRPEVVNLDQLEAVFEAGEIVNAKKLIQKNLIKSAKTGIKILGKGTLTKKLTVAATSFSETAKDAIIKAGGKIQHLS
jgi:large subunit ribosomal protein L15